MKISNRDAVARIADRAPFANHTGSFRGEHVTHTPSLGRLTADQYEFAALRDATYVVWSYATPIAWWSLGRGWTVPQVRYSATTTRHQFYVRQAVAR